nr:MAG TPA: hypothetical protein [Caudoviricetes sp.]
MPEKATQNNFELFVDEKNFQEFFLFIPFEFLLFNLHLV